MSGRVKQLSAGQKGFDANFGLTPRSVAAFKTAGYDFAVRYVRRATRHSYDLTIGEVQDILNVGLGLMIVQHVAPDGWLPNATLGSYYGNNAAFECDSLRITRGTTVWCDLEGVASTVPASDVIAYCNAWYDRVRFSGFEPGLYVGAACGLSAHDLYWRLKFRRYWAAYNLNSDEVPEIRGVQMQQRAMTAADKVPGVETPFDVNYILEDAKGSLPSALVLG